MKSAFTLVTLFCAAVVLQLGLFPAFVPTLLQPDVGLLIAMAALAFCPREFALIALFVLGLHADLFGSARFGLLTLSYLLSAGLILCVAWRELTRGDLLAAWAGGVAATLLAHSLYVLLGLLCGFDVRWGQAFATLLARMLAALIWGLPLAWACAQWLYRLGMMAPPVHERWAAEIRLAAARRGKVMRG
ncbi:MAG TPA: hypothetical protein VGP72_13715 [Planctomycetota bacterium]|jgi:cell shape-determining protein MreD